MRPVRHIEGEPTWTLHGRDVHAPSVLRALAAKHRPSNPEFSASADATATAMEAWQRAHPSVKL